MIGIWWQCGVSGSSSVSDISPITISMNSERSVKGVGGIKGLAPAGPGVAAVQYYRGKNRLSFINLEDPKKSWSDERELSHYQSAYVVGPWIGANYHTDDRKSHSPVLFDARIPDGGRPRSLDRFGRGILPMSPVGKVILMSSGTILDPETESIETVTQWPPHVYAPIECLPTDVLTGSLTGRECLLFSATNGREMMRCDTKMMISHSCFPEATHWWPILCRGSLVVFKVYKSASHYGLIGYDGIQRSIRWQIPHIATGYSLRSNRVSTLDGDELVLIDTPMPGPPQSTPSDSEFTRSCHRYAIIRINVETGVLRATPLQGPIWDRQMLRPEGHLCLHGYTATLSDSLDRDAPQQWVMELYRNADGTKVAERWFKGYAAACVWRDQVVVANGNRLEILARQDAPV